MTEAPTTPAPCPVCGAVGTLRTREEKITRKRRSKFGFLWVLATVLTGGLAFVAWLVWPRHSEVIGVDRSLQCSSCGSRV